MKKLNISYLIDDGIENLSSYERKASDWLEDTGFFVKEVFQAFVSLFKKCPACHKYEMMHGSCKKCSYLSCIGSQYIRKGEGWCFSKPGKIEYYKGFELIGGDVYKNNIFIGKAPEKDVFKYLEKLSLL